MKRFALIVAASLLVTPVAANELAESIQQDYDEHLGPLWDHFHRNPELSTVEFKTAARMAEELKAALAEEPTIQVCNERSRHRAMREADALSRRPQPGAAETVFRRRALDAASGVHLRFALLTFRSRE